ncbi:ABC transporter permease [Actinomadura sp. CNU-125]|uniref:ABC transporter permease n=1 Tax=Actinomadura sp. CNU-125 TaxID=1904961 RepID=UPI0021CC9DDD|nr:ABC transporter permease [Actinomadura sp. CNU-125]
MGAASVTTAPTLVGVYLGQAPIAILGVLVITGEYTTGMIGTTFTAVPHRATVLAAKAIVLATAVAAAVLGSLLAGRLVLGHRAPTGEAAAGTILYLILIALLSLGTATAVRDSATAIGAVLALLYVLPIVSRTIADPRWQRVLQKITPMPPDPADPWTPLAATATWTTAALLTATVLLHTRDA